MRWHYASISEFEPHVTAYQVDIDARWGRVKNGEMEQAVEVEIDDLAEILTAGKELFSEFRDPRDVDQLKRLRVDGTLREDYFYLSKPVNGCRIVYFRNILTHQVTVAFVYNVNYSRLVPARGMLTLVNIDNDA